MIIEDNFMETPGVEVLGITDLKLIAEEESNRLELLNEQPKIFLDAVASHVTEQFRINKEAKRKSGIEDMITESSEQYNGEYSAKELSAIKAQGGSDIYMNITATKCRAAASWIRDILLATNMKSWTLKVTPDPDLPKAASAAIEKAIAQEFQLLVNQTKQEQAKQQQQEQQQGQQELPPTTATEAQETIREVNQNKRDIKDAIFLELQKEAEFGMKVMERQIDDQLTEGGWYKAFSLFIDDFVVYPSAFIKGPIVTNDTKLSYLNGQLVPSTKYCYKNRRVSPYDMYPAPEATSLQDGALCEHLRFTGVELNTLIGVDGYKDENIIKCLQDGPQDSYDWLDTGIEQDKAEQEKRGDTFDANQNIYHGIHFFGPIKASCLIEWGIQDLDVLAAQPYEEFECEVILAGNHTIKCVLNDDPLLRRPYYCASYQQRPGSVWGRSLPSLMRDIQRFCNATARALANNMALAAGPQIEVYIQRIADMSDLEDIYPFKVWQLDVDPTGAGGRGINFFQPSSNAAELLKVYQEFELKADDATGIPRYAYGNENTGQVPSTLGGLSILLESASKGIKDAIRNIDSGVIIPRVEYQFYMNILENKIKYTGDPNVVALGSSTLTLKGSEQIKRNEFLQITANAIDQKIMGEEGRATLLREMAKDLGFIEDIVPSRLDMKKQKKKAEQNMQQQMQAQQQAEAEKQQTSLQATQMQVQGQMQMNQLAQQVRSQIEQLKDQRKAIDQQLKALDLELKEKQIVTNAAVATAGQDKDFQKQSRELALKMQQGEGI